jgi:hypothetical protein
MQRQNDKTKSLFAILQTRLKCNQGYTLSNTSFFHMHHAPTYILAATPQCPKVQNQSEILKLEKHSLNHALNYTTSRLHKTGNTPCIPGDARQYSDNYSPVGIRKSFPNLRFIIFTFDSKQCFTQDLYNESTTVTNLWRSITDDYCCNYLDSLHDSKVRPRSTLSTSLIIITPNRMCTSLTTRIHLSFQKWAHVSAYF